MQYAYSLLTVKSVDDSQRVITGIASTPTVDRVGDVVEPMGARFKVPMPLLLYHDAERPVGRVEFAKPTKEGIPFRATLPNVTEPGVVQDRVNEALHSLKYLLVGAVSIGFRAVEDGVELMKSGGLRFKQWEWLELSLCSIPANPDAVIQSFKSMDARRIQTVLGERPSDESERTALIKALDTNAQAATGPKGGSVEPLETTPGDSGKANAAKGGSVQPNPRKPIMKTISEQISALEATRAAKAARLEEVMQKSLAEGRATDDAEGDEFDEVETEVKRIDADLVRLRRLEKLNMERAKAVDGTSSDAGTGSRGPTIIMRSQEAPEAFKGQGFVRKIIAKAVARLEDTSATSVAMHRWGKTNPNLVNIIKVGEVPGGGTGSTEWGHELVTQDNRYTGDFIEFLYARTVYDKLPLRRVPQNVMIKGQDGAATGYWVGESKAIPATTADFFDVSLTPLKVAALAVISNELIRDSSPDAEMMVRDALVQASSQRVDQTFLSAAAAVAGVSPAGILNGVTGIAASGTDAAALRADVKALYASFIAAKNSTDVHFISNPSLAKSIQLMVNALGQTAFGEISTNGGTLLGDMVHVGENVPAGNLILLKPADIYRIGDLGVQVSVSREAMIEQNVNPTGATDTPVAASATMTSMFQSESTAIKVVRPISFAKRRASAVAFITGANYI